METRVINTTGDTGLSTDAFTDMSYHANKIIPLGSIPLPILIAKLIAFASIMFVTIVGNGIVITIIFRNKHMQNTTYYYLLNLAVADILIAVLNEWIWVMHHLTENWMFGSLMCKFSGFIVGVSVHVSILTLTVVAGDRYFAIIHPLKSRVIKGKGNGVVLILSVCCVWCIAVIINIPAITAMQYFPWTWDDGITQVYCSENWDVYEHLKRWYTFLLFIFMYVIPLGIMLFAYVRIAMTLSSRGSRIECTTTAQDKSKRKVVKMLVVVISAFAVCWLPYHIYHLVRYFSARPENDAIFFGVLWLGYFNSAMNPFIYCGFNENFRRGFRDAFTGKWCAKVHDDKTSSKLISSAQTDGTLMETVI